MLEADPYARFRLKPGAKRVVTFLPEAPTTVPRLPIELDDAAHFVPEDRPDAVIDALSVSE